MAIYSIHVSVVRRSFGKNAVATSAYNSRSRLKLYFKNVQCGGKRKGKGYKIYDYRRRKGLTFSKIIAQEDAPDWVYDREILWNKCEEVELRRNSQTARKIMLALPIELSQEQNHQLIEEFSRKYLVAHGMVVDINVHYDNPKNPHAHLQMTTRELVKENGIWHFSKKKNHSWSRFKFLYYLRQGGAVVINEYLEKNGIEARVSHLSYKKQGIDKIAMIHEGTTHHIEGSERRKINEMIKLKTLNKRHKLGK